MNTEKISIGIDVGGTKISAATVQNGQIISEIFAYKTPNTSQEILKTILKAIEELKKQYSSKFVGIATAGTVNISNSKVTGSTGNLPEDYSNLEFKKEIEEQFGLKTFVENDANAAAYAEFKNGNAKNDNSTIVITLGTGIGGGIIINGKLLRGKSGAAAEIGHIPINIENKRQCTCGTWNCWESFASGTGYALNAREMAKGLSEIDLHSLFNGKKAEELTTYDIIEKLKTNDPFAIKVHEYWEKVVAIGIIALVNIFDPDSIILSGGMAKFVNFEKLSREVEKNTIISKIKLLPAKAENYAGIIGAAMLAEENLE